MSNQIFLGNHILAEYHVCNAKLLNDSDFLEKTLLESAKKAGANVISSHFHAFSPVGITGIVLIAESHFSIHTWPEHQYAAVDFFTCSPKMNFQIAYDWLANALESEKHFFKSILRGQISNYTGKTD
ncbi:MAG: adenosylmethionine decarboxylase [Bacteroidetes bacterium]|nr:MAG: adenosylmethionine decarboxylase [Bacteroidota bacterium]